MTSSRCRGGGKAQIAPFGVLLIERYREVEQKLNEVAGDRLDQIRRRVNRNAVKVTRKIPVSKSKKRKQSA